MGRKIKVLYASSECAPYARTGGLGDVGGALPEPLKDKGIDIIRVIPRYRSINCESKYIMHFSVPMGERYQTCIIEQIISENNVPTYFICCDWYFNRDKLYGYNDDAERFLFFCKSVIIFAGKMGRIPDLIHCNDWHTGFIPFMVKKMGSNIKTLFTIHNLRYQGWISCDFVKEYKPSYDELVKLGYPEYLNFMKSGIIYSDFISTVSRGYSREILKPENGEGMDKLLLERKKSLCGIINGIDLKEYDPEDAEFPYDSGCIDIKKKNKLLLQKELGLRETDLPLVSSVTRLDDQKGIDIMIEAIRKMELNGFEFVILGTGDNTYEKILEELSQTYNGRFKACIKFDSSLSKRIYAGSDIFLMPSRYEPGGLGQLYAMRYGTVPVVRHTGGLKDTVIDIKKGKDKATGFCFTPYSAASLANALKRAINLYGSPAWDSIVKNCMTYEFSWEKSAARYIKLYKSILHKEN